MRRHALRTAHRQLFAILRPFSLAAVRLLFFLLWTWAAVAQELPPPGGWPLRTVTELRAVPEPPGGLVPYRQGQLWGFADTTGRVWIRPVFASEPPRFGAGLLLQAQQRGPKVYRPAQKIRRIGLNGQHGPWRRYKEPRPRQSGPSRFTLNNVRFGQLLTVADYSRAWAILCEKPAKAGLTWLVNARGEQLVVHPNKAVGQTSGGNWRVVTRRGPFRGQPELVAIAPHELESKEVQPGRLFTVPLGGKAPTPPSRLTRNRAYAPNADFTDSFVGSAPMYLAQKVNWLRPTRQVWRHGRCGDQFEDTDTRYQHEGQFALFNAKGHRLTDYRYSGMKRLLPQRLAYWHWSAGKYDYYEDQKAADSSGMPRGYDLREDINGPARRYGLLDRNGRELTPPLFVRMQAAGPNSLWVVAVRGGRLHYGLIDTLGHDQLPLRPEPISLPDAAGLLRRYSTAPLPAVKSPETFQLELRYPDTASVQYLHADGRLAFAGRYAQAGAFWQGRALVKQGAAYGIIDSLGRWVLRPQPDRLRYYGFGNAHHNLLETVDPLELFAPFSAGQRGMPHWGTRPGDPLLLLTSGPQGYGLRDGRTGRVVVPAVFDERPEQWHGGVVGQRGGQPLGYSYRGTAFDPNAAFLPPGVRQPKLTDAEYQPYRPLLQRTEQGWRTRGGRQLWQD